MIGGGKSLRRTWRADGSREGGREFSVGGLGIVIGEERVCGSVILGKKIAELS